MGRCPPTPGAALRPRRGVLVEGEPETQVEGPARSRSLVRRPRRLESKGLLMGDVKLTAGEQRLVDATVSISRLALYLGMTPVELRSALGVCGLLVVKDAKGVVDEHEALFVEWEEVP